MRSKLRRQTGFELLVLESVTGPLYVSVTEEKNPGVFVVVFLTLTAQCLETGFLKL